MRSGIEMGRWTALIRGGLLNGDVRGQSGVLFETF